MARLLALKVSFIKLGITQYEAARRLHMSETRLSRIMCGRIEPTPEEKKKLAQLVGASVATLFG